MNNVITNMIVIISAFFTTSICFSQQNIPSSLRSREAISRTIPVLKKQLEDRNLELGSPIFIRIFKEEMALELWMKKKNEYVLFKSYPICTYGFGGLGPKTREGDGKAPEGFYFVTPSQLNPFSKFHLSFNLGYPNKYDRYYHRTGGALMVHGDCVSIGCYSMTNDGIDEIYGLVYSAFRNGQPFFRVHIFPFKMTSANMEKHKKSKWYNFWTNLKDGYDTFVTNRIPPNVEVRMGRYVFEKQ